jgi:hypothetical protein
VELKERVKNTKDSAGLDMQRAFRDLLSELVQWSEHEIFCDAAVGGQVHRCRDLVHRIEIRDGP